jgi:hypothetical protein
MTTSHYPNLTRDSVRVILAAGPGGVITPALVAQVTGDIANFVAIVDDLNRAHMLDPSGELTPLADNYARICRTFLSKDGP